MSAFGQEPWAQEALAELRHDWPDWAFLVVGYRWLALRGKQQVISASGPQELRYALPPLPPERPEPGSAEAVPAFGSASPGPVDHGVPGPGQVRLPTLAELLHGAPGVSWTRASTPPSTTVPTSGAGAHPDDAGGGDGAGAGLSGPLTAAAPPPGVMTAERSVTDTWAVAGMGVGGARVAWWQAGWWPWGRGRGRPRPNSPVGKSLLRRAGPGLRAVVGVVMAVPG
ncbi:hypothetical protein [Nonomuraea typhae]|uniref:hypothetical protein n=1 Tax=Nonomuraea typhae TaxID=2603600 RepID=UPI0012F7159A|nr:hypothetical protein [Nonomuraea typhae]